VGIPPGASLDVNIKVKRADGAGTISGEAKIRAEKDLVTKIAGDIHRVQSVLKNMKIKK